MKKGDFTGNAGKSFLAHFDNSLADAVISVYGSKHQVPKIKMIKIYLNKIFQIYDYCILIQL